LEERREYKRLIRYLNVIEQTTGKLIGRIGDIHNTGLLLVSEHEIPLLMDISIWLEVPGEKEIKNRVPLVINGTWNQMNRNPDFYNTGCWIVNPPLDAINAIEKLIEELTP
jgi:hypothetical protein